MPAPAPSRLVLALTVLCGASAALAALPTFWILESQADFLQGEVEGLSITSEGTLTLAPTTRNLHEATDPFIWSLTADREGNLFAGSGNEGRIFKVTASGQTSVFADTNELSVHALAVDREGNLYAGTSPQGKVYKIEATGSATVFFDPDDRYVWALTFDETGNLYVATGENGRLYRVKRNGESEVVFESHETHLMCLAVDGNGNVYAGSDSSGLVLKIDRAGKVSVLFDSPFQEIHALVVDARGTVYAAAINGEKGGAPLTPSPPTVTPSTTEPTPALPPAGGGESVTVTVSAVALLPAPGTSATPSGTARGALYRVSPEGAAELVWSSPEDTPLSLKLERDDRLMVGTGKAGRIYLVRKDKTSSLLLKAEADQVTGLHGADRDGVYFATSNPARIVLVGAERRLEGTFRSPIKDTQTVSTWGKIRWEAGVPPGAGLVLQTRSGNSAKPDNTWSDWSASYTLPEGDQIQSPRGRFLQWRAVLKTGSGVTPELHAVTTVYLQQNLRPEVTEITIHPAGETFQKPLLTTGQIEILGLETPLQSTETDPFGLTLGAQPGSTGGGTQASRRSGLPLTTYSKKIQNKGYQTVSWAATDPNDDTLTYEVHYRAEGESLWKLLRRDLREPIIAWDTVAMPDGRYMIKVVASDAAGNPQALAATGERESRPFEIDNTPPRLADLRITPASGGGWQVQFVASDDSSPVRSVEYAVDSGRWNVIYPEDGIADSKRERFDLKIPAQGSAVRTLVIRVTDRLSNVGTTRGELRP